MKKSRSSLPSFDFLPLWKAARMWKKTSIYTVKKNSLISLKSTNARRPQKEVKNLTVKSPGKAKNLTIIRR